MRRGKGNFVMLRFQVFFKENFLIFHVLCLPKMPNALVTCTNPSTTVHRQNATDVSFQVQKVKFADFGATKERSSI